MDKLVRVPRSTIKRGITVHRKKAAANPNKPGPKPKDPKLGAAKEDRSEQ